MRVAALGCALLVAAAACTSGADRPSGATVDVLDGTVEVARPGEPYRVVDATTRLAFGDRVRTTDDGSARLRVGDASGEIGRLTEVWVESSRPFLRTGSVLATDGLRLEVGEGEVDSTGTVRVERGLSLRVGAYEGAGTLSVGARSVVIERYREASAAPDFFPRATRPLRVTPADPWDRRLLGAELEFERAVERTVQGIAAQGADIRRALTNGPRVVPVLGTGLNDLELVVATAIADATPGSYTQALRGAIALRTEGGGWSVVVASLRTDTAAVLAAIQDAVEGALSTPSPTLGPGPSPGPSPGPTAPPPSPGPTAPPPPTPTPACPGCGGVELLLCEVTGICGDLPFVP